MGEELGEELGVRSVVGARGTARRLVSLKEGPDCSGEALRPSKNLHRGQGPGL